MTGTARLAIAAFVMGLVLPSVSQAHWFLDWYPTSAVDRLIALRIAMVADFRAEAAKREQELEQDRVRYEATLLGLMGHDDPPSQRVRADIDTQIERINSEKARIQKSLGAAVDYAWERSDKIQDGLGLWHAGWGRGSKFLDDDSVRQFLTKLADEVYQAALKPMTPSLQEEVRDHLVNAFLAVQFLQVNDESLLATPPDQRSQTVSKLDRHRYGRRAYAAATGAFVGSLVTAILALGPHELSLPEAMFAGSKALVGGYFLFRAYERLAILFDERLVNGGRDRLARRIARSNGIRRGWRFFTPVQFNQSLLAPLEQELLQRQAGLLRSFTDRLSSKMGGPASALVQLQRLVGEGFERLADPMTLLSSGEGMSFCGRELLRLRAAAAQLPAELDLEVTP